MLIIAGNILPIFFLILIGFLFKQSGFPGNNFWVPAERLAYYVLLPALIIRNLTNTDLSTLPTGPMALTIFSLGASMTLIILIIKPILIFLLPVNLTRSPTLIDQLQSFFKKSLPSKKWIQKIRPITSANPQNLAIFSRVSNQIH